MGALMSEAQETPASPSGLTISLLGLLWLGLAVGYLAASASGHRTLALATIGLMIGALLVASGRRVMGVFTGLALASASLYWADAVFIVVYVPPLAAFAFMAYFFHRTLRDGVEPLITRVARKEHPDLPVEMARYTRTLTWVWSLCFVLLLLIALVLAPLLPLDLWSRWIHGLGYGVPSILFLGEYAYRHRRFPNHSHGSLTLLTLNIVTVSKEAALALSANRSQGCGPH